MKRNLILSVICALVAGLFAMLYLYDIQTKQESVLEPVKVVVAKQKIEQGKIIDSSMIVEKIVPKQYVQPKYISSVKDFYSNSKPAFVAIVGFEEGEQITYTKVSSILSGAGVSNSIPNDNRAITLSFSRDEINGIIIPGSRVDLIAIVEYEDINNVSEQSSAVVAQNLLVLAVGNKIIGTTQTKQEEISVKVPVTFSATISQAQQIMLAQSRGIIKIALRPSADTTISTDLQIVKLYDIFSDAKRVATNNNVNAAKARKQMQQRQKEIEQIINKYSSQQ